MKKIIISSMLGIALLALPALASAYYPYAWFTGTSYLTGPSSFTGYGGFSTGPVGIQSQPFDLYAAYGSGTFQYNPMTGQGDFGNQGYGGYGGYGTNNYDWQQYVPGHVQQYVNINSGWYNSGTGGYPGWGLACGTYCM